MKHKNIFFIWTALLVFASILLINCEHYELMDSDGGIPPGEIDTLSQFSVIQKNIFDQKCAVPGCHVEGTAAFDLVLSEGRSYGNLLNISSGEIPTLKLVKPGNPDSSYIVWKIEGRAGIVGERMPRGRPPLSQDEIDSVIRWIKGATNN
jgi:hypothetical protein